MAMAAPIAAVGSMGSMRPTRSQHLHPHGSGSSDGNSNSNSNSNSKHKRKRKCTQHVPETPAASTPVFLSL